MRYLPILLLALAACDNGPKTAEPCDTQTRFTHCTDETGRWETVQGVYWQADARPWGE